MFPPNQTVQSARLHLPTRSYSAAGNEQRLFNPSASASTSLYLCSPTLDSVLTPAAPLSAMCILNSPSKPPATHMFADYGARAGPGGLEQAILCVLHASLATTMPEVSKSAGSACAATWLRSNVAPRCGKLADLRAKDAPCDAGTGIAAGSRAAERIRQRAVGSSARICRSENRIRVGARFGLDVQRFVDRRVASSRLGNPGLKW